MTDFKKYLGEFALEAESKLEEALSYDKLGGRSPMTEAMRYAVLGGGKRIRAFLTMEFCRMLSGNTHTAWNYACAMEMAHAYSLIHDDLPCMDNDDMRRGRPSCHKAFGETVALLAGDALLTYAFRTAVAEGEDADALAVKILSDGAGCAGMCRGQELDLATGCESYESLVQLHDLKTGALIRCASLLGCVAALGHSDTELFDKVTEYALSLGLAFQIEDDLLDVCGDQATLGKPVGSDDKNGKKTVLSFMTFEEARAEIGRLSRKAANVFADFDNSEAVCALPLYLENRNM